MKCKTHPDAPHGFDRNGSHSEDRYVCMCEHWEPPEPRALVLAELLEQNALMPLDDVAAAELRRLHDENEALKAAQYECGFGAGCCYQAAKSEADEVLLRQALEALDPPGQLRFGGTGRLKAAAIAAIKERLK